MRHLFILVFSALALASLTGAAQAADDIAPEETMMHESGSEGWPSMSFEGGMRRYLLYVPDTVKAAGKPAPLVVMLHGAGGGADRMKISLGWDELADKQNFVMLYPQGVNNAWNDGRPSEVRPKRVGSRANDIGYINALVDKLVADKIADPARVYLAGLANGGFMTTTIACTSPEKFAAFATIISSAAAVELESCTPKRALPFAMLNGTADPLIPWSGSGEGSARMSAIPELFEFWANRNGCKTRGEEKLADTYPADGIIITVVKGSDCENGSAVDLFRFDGMGHQIPTPRTTQNERLRAAMFGTRSIDYDASELLWPFFSRFKK